jgi:hypothetical protein
VTALLCIDTQTNRVRRYAPRRVGGTLTMTDEGLLQMHSPTIMQGIEAFRQNGMAAIESDESPSQAA